MTDRTEEPHEPDPEADLRDPNSDSVTIPRVETEDAGSGLVDEFRSEFETEDVEAPDLDPETSDVPPELLKAFWAIVLVVNGALLAFSLGALIIVFWGDLERGLPLLAGGTILSAFAYRRYRTYQRWQAERDEGEAEGENETDAEPDGDRYEPNPDSDDEAGGDHEGDDGGADDDCNDNDPLEGEDDSDDRT